jgi:hypothetical protein
MYFFVEPLMTAIEDIQEAISMMEASLETDFMTEAVRDIMTTAVSLLKDAESQPDNG